MSYLRWFKENDDNLSDEINTNMKKSLSLNNLNKEDFKNDLLNLKKSSSVSNISYRSCDSLDNEDMWASSCDNELVDKLTESYEYRLKEIENKIDVETAFMKKVFSSFDNVNKNYYYYKGIVNGAIFGAFITWYIC